jgi:outer membrane protein, multidrug efflux system
MECRHWYIMRLTWAGLALGMAACALLAEKSPVEVNLPAHFRNDPSVPALLPGPLGAVITIEPQEIVRRLELGHAAWVTALGSNELNGLVSEALSNNHELKGAAARTEQARARLGIAGASLWPSVQLTASRQGGKPLGGINPQFPISNPIWQRESQLALGASYEVDFWGKNQFARKAASATLDSSSYAADTVRVGLVSEVVIAYLDYLEALERISVAGQNVAAMDVVLSIVSKRHELGISTGIDVERQAAALGLARANLSPLEVSREAAIDRLAYLLGKHPSQLGIAASSLRQLKIPVIPSVLPSSLLALRPDVRGAEADLRAADANIGAARASFLPDFSLSAADGFVAAGVGGLLTPANAYKSLALSMTQLIFDGGKIKSQLDFSKAVSAEAVQAYEQTIVTAVRDVEDALASVRIEAELEATYASTIVHTKAAFSQAREGFLIGTADYTSLLDAARTDFSAEDAAVHARYMRLLAAVDVYRSLGGGEFTQRSGPS